ncbi:MAG TPA: glutathione S-transferase [Microvirga sp.]|jgi:glutathione S-transferase|nr:glutathione S-transferase [Microvirga sp.]
MRKLYFTTGSPFARAVRIVLAEKGLPFERDETYTTPSVEERARVSPTLQVPTLVDGDLRLWDSSVILEYLMATYPNAPAPAGHPPFAEAYVRPDHPWKDRLVHATLQTLGASTATVSQLQWAGIRHEENGHGSRCAARNQHLLDWFEAELAGVGEGFVPGVVSVQDVMLTAWCEFIERRPLRLTWRAAHRPKLEALVRRLRERPSFRQEPVLWWEPGVTYASPEEVAWAAAKTVDRGPGFAEWRAARSTGPEGAGYQRSP